MTGMNCKFKTGKYSGVGCNGQFIQLTSLKSDDAELFLSEIGLLNTYKTKEYTICEHHLNYVKEENCLTWVRRKCGIPSSISAHKGLAKGDRKITRDIMCKILKKELSVLQKVKPVDMVETICHESFSVNCFSNMSNADSQRQPVFSQDSEASVCGIGKLEKLNALIHLEITNVSPIKEKTTPLSTSCEKTRKKCVSKALECLTAICSTICPGEGEELENLVLHATQTLLNEKITKLDQTSLILKEVYLQAESWTLQIQILSMICKDRIFGEIKEPGSSIRPRSTIQMMLDVVCQLYRRKKSRNRVDNEKLEHFIDYILSSNIIKDLPYGTKTMKLSSGEIVEVPNLIRSLPVAPSSLIIQYIQYCEAEDIKLLGGRSFLDLENIIEKLEITDEKKKGMVSCLLSGKSYLKSAFKVHIEAESNIADHCRLFALSEGEVQCGHSHTEICLQCRNLDEILNEISTIVQNVNWENKDAVESAVDSITDWKAHIMRSRNQEDARRDLGNKLISYNFSEAQDGKGPCDRRASHIKSVVKRYINEGHDVTSAEEMKVAIDARQNGQSRVKVVDTFESGGLRVWKAYTIGKGQLIPWKSLGSPPKATELLVKLN
ncbi:unnamed protein product [Mytilus coruscus]|uniref:Uncharacterized protein n=1 Tax=Mytilus coruscus TaxID=42192 RepID=A0A6J8CJ24_MYTCO|nr:unnamed protein product [Mytilus coruscus]